MTIQELLEELDGYGIILTDLACVEDALGSYALSLETVVKPEVNENDTWFPPTKQEEGEVKSVYKLTVDELAAELLAPGWAETDR